jgi:CelD/BcsL family acetyltransferase involved in cellulose biosynthesis
MLKEVHEVDPAAWRTFYEREPGCPVFQSPHFATYMAGTPGFQPIAVGVQDERGHLMGLMLACVQREPGLKRRFSARSIVNGGPVISGEAGPRRAEVLALLIEAYERNLPHDVIYTEVRNFGDRQSDAGGFLVAGFRYEDHWNFLVDLNPDPEEVFKRVHATKRRQIRKALKSGATVDGEPSAEDLNRLHAILRDLYRNRVGKPLPAESFLLDFCRSGQGGSCGKVFVVKDGSRVIGGIVCPITRGETIYEWYVCGDRRHDSLFPSLLATWAPIEWGCRNGLKTFDFMGAGKPGEAYGVREFKKNFNGRLVNYGRFRKVHRPAFMAIGRMGLAVLRRVKR